ncbi:MAG: alginate export family protein [Alphaproteobacteria bacterium]|nr:alginate export family protein [Alphaproteobacteria bacterium]
MTYTRIVSRNILLASTAALLMIPQSVFAGQNQTKSLSDAVTSGKVYLKVRIRNENVDQANFANKANALTIRTIFGYKTGSYNGFSGVLEMEDSRNLANENYNNTINGKGNIYPVIADPSHTEVNQAYLSYSGINGTKISVGRQSINLGTQRFVGTVGWRQDDQNLDAVSVVNNSLPKTKIFYAFVWNVNRIFSNRSPAGDHSSRTHLFNVDYSGLKFGKLTAYAYLLDNRSVAAFSSNTFGVRFAGKTAISGNAKLLYQFEYANQTNTKNNPGNFSVNYFHIGGGVGIAGAVMKAGLESLGSDNGTASFKTPLATLHKFNGWADQFLKTPATGLNDLYFTGVYKFNGAAKGLKAVATYHKFTAQFGNQHYGNEIDLLLAYKINRNYSVAVKYADYTADSWKVNVKKLWLTLGMKF